MTKKELKVIYRTISTAQETIEYLACENYPFTEFRDEDLEKMFRELNRMCLKLHEKMEGMA